MCVICVVKVAWLVYKWQNYCTLAFTDCDIKVQYTLPLDNLYSGLRTHTRRLWDLSSFKLLVDCCPIVRIPILCRQIYDNYFSNNVSAGKIIFFWGGHLFVRTSLPFCNNVTLTSVVLFGALVMIFCLQTRVKICHLNICHKQIKRGKNTIM